MLRLRFGPRVRPQQHDTRSTSHGTCHSADRFIFSSHVLRLHKKHKPCLGLASKRQGRDEWTDDFRSRPAPLKTLTSHTDIPGTLIVDGNKVQTVACPSRNRREPRPHRKATSFSSFIDPQKGPISRDNSSVCPRWRHTFKNKKRLSEIEELELDRSWLRGPRLEVGDCRSREQAEIMP